MSSSPADQIAETIIVTEDIHDVWRDFILGGLTGPDVECPKAYLDTVADHQEGIEAAMHLAATHQIILVLKDCVAEANDPANQP